MTAPTLADRYLIPPLSVIDTRGGWWRNRKRAWLATGIDSGQSREGSTVGGLTQLSRATADMTGNLNRGASEFDPVLCEIVYRWWAPAGGTVLDPFAGGSVRGIVAARLGLDYHGVDLRPEQVNVNRANADAVLPDGVHRPEWYVGDATRTAASADLPAAADLVFSCPPYADLERYSDDPADLSTMPYPEFREAHASAIRQACDRLRPDSFAVWVIGEARDRNRGLYGLVGDTVRAFQDAGMEYTSEAVLVAPVATAAMRAGRGFDGGRVLTRCHQNVLVFCKGNRNRAAKRLGAVDVSDVLATRAEDEPHLFAA